MTGTVLICVAVAALISAQLIIKASLTDHGVVPASVGGFVSYVRELLLDWRAWMGGIGLVISSVLWYAAISRIPLSVAYPIGAISYPLIFLGSVFILGESFSWIRLAANALIVAGIILSTFARSHY
ncbi:MAG TPA: hypothetical protein VGC26_10235 [Afipia sp.]